MDRFWLPLRAAGGKTTITVLGGLVLCTLYLYPGNHAFFEAHLADALPPAFWEWGSQIWQCAAAFVLLWIVPALWTRFGLAERLPGMTLGDWRFGLRFLGLAILVLPILLWVNAGSAEFQAEYPLVKAAATSWQAFVAWEACYLVYYIAWESFFRGFWQLGLAPRIGDFAAMGLQVATSTVMHIGKPAGETFSAIVGGVLFGLVALRTRSVVWVILVHWIVGILTDLFCSLRAA